MVVVETARGITIRVRFLPLILTSLGSKSGTLLYLNRGKRVNTILGDSKPEISRVTQIDQKSRTKH